ncbi:MAG: TRAP transporter substrate-binding protein [Hyphomicrobiaceae bacterium]
MTVFLRMLLATFLTATFANAKTLTVSDGTIGPLDIRAKAAKIFIENASSAQLGIEFDKRGSNSSNAGPRGEFELLQSGKIDILVYPLSDLADRIPTFGYATLPGLLPNIESAIALRETPVYDLLQSAAHQNGFHILTWWWMRGGLVARDTTIRTPNDIAGLRVRSDNPFGQLMLYQADAEPVALPPTKIYGALQSGKIDAAFTSFQNSLTSNLHRQSKYAVFGGASLWMSLTPMLISKKTWDTLNRRQKRALDCAAGIADAAFYQLERDVLVKALAQFIKAGVPISSLSADEFAAWLKLAQRTSWARYVESHPRSSKLLTTTVENLRGSGPDSDPLAGAMCDEKLRD